ncbi:hypothetical protein BGX28_003546 [Mortierella sp. GBA30]|nr:hypothetical protein BGX28_003546 [Mortierella sp. GBA30]
MEFFNSPSASFVTSSASAGAYYMYSKIIGSKQQAKRALRAEQAQKELLQLEEEEKLKRGPNRQVKKKPVAAAHLRKVDPTPDNDTCQTLNENIPISNSFMALEGNGTAFNQNSPRTKKGIRRLTLTSRATVSVSKLQTMVSTAEHTMAESAADLKEVSDKVVEEVVVSVTHQEFAALKALLQAKDMALAAADAHAENLNRRIQDLHKQIETDQKVVQAAKEIEAGAQKQEEKLESLNYTNTLLVQQLCLELENRKAVAEMSSCRTCTSLVRNVKDAQTRIDAAVKERDDMQLQATKVLSQKESTIEGLEAEVKGLKRMIEEYADAMEHVKSVADTQRLNLEQDKRTLIEEIDRIKDDRALKARKIERAMTKVMKIQAKYDALLSSKDATSMNSQSTLSVQEYDISDVGERMSRVISELEVAQAEIQSLTARLSDMQEDYKLSLLHVAELEHELGCIRQQNYAMKEDVEIIAARPGVDENIATLIQEATEEQRTAPENARDKIEVIEMSLEVPLARDMRFTPQWEVVAVC